MCLRVLFGFCGRSSGWIECRPTEDMTLFCIILKVSWSKCSRLLFDIYYQQTLKLLKEYQRGYPDSFNIYKHSFWAIFSRWVIPTLLNNIGFGLLILSGILSFSAV